MCSHNIVEDYIDIDSDRCKQIFYCDRCFESFCGPINKSILLDNLQEFIELNPINEIFKQETPRQCLSIQSCSLRESEADSSSPKLRLKVRENCNTHTHQK